MKRSTLFLAPLLLLTFSIARATTQAHGPSPEIAPETQTDKIEIARLRIQNTQLGPIEGSRDGGKTWTRIGYVTTPTTKTNPRGFNASKYGPAGTVVATAVNAIHLKAGQNTKENRGVIWSLAPAAEDAAGTVSLQSEVSPGSAVYTDIRGGEGIFGGPFTPFVGNPIFLDNDKNNDLKKLPDNYVPKIGDVWTIQILRPRRYPHEIVFENRFGGLITITYLGEQPRVIGQVLRPVEGIGRFVGSYFSEVGRLRANHNGVIDISTSPRGKIGSFQIVPANHAMSAETHYIRELTQWMVVGPVSALDPSWEGVAPLYSGFLRPRYEAADFDDPDVMEGLLGRFRFQVKTQGSDEWKEMPTLYMEPGAPLPQWAGTALSNVTHIRILFPFTWMEKKDAVLIVPKDEEQLKQSYLQFVKSLDTTKIEKEYPKAVAQVRSNDPRQQVIGLRVLQESREIEAIPLIVPLLDSPDGGPVPVAIQAGSSLSWLVEYIALDGRRRNQETGEDVTSYLFKPLPWIVFKLLQKPDDGNTHAYAANIIGYAKLREFEGETAQLLNSRHPAVTNAAKYALEQLKQNQ